jgi:hypothetical protein
MATSVKNKKSETKIPQKAGQPKKLSKLGEWLRKHPHGDGTIIYDRSVLYGENSWY